LPSNKPDRSRAARSSPTIVSPGFGDEGKTQVRRENETRVASVQNCGFYLALITLEIARSARSARAAIRRLVITEPGDYRARKCISERAGSSSREHIETPGRYEISRASCLGRPRVYTAGLAFSRTPESATHHKRHMAERAPAVHAETTMRAKQDGIGDGTEHQVQRTHTIGA